MQIRRVNRAGRRHARPAGAELSKVLAPDAIGGRPLRLRGDVRQVAGVFRQVRSRQLVILGAPPTRRRPR